MMGSDSQSFARRWVAAWNEHDLEAILSHYAADVVFTSPFVSRLTARPDGTLQGLPALREYFGLALKHFPDLHFRLWRVLPGVGSVVLVYESVQGLLAAEVMELNGDGKVAQVRCHYMTPDEGMRPAEG
jgi:hypothetical protein